MAPWLTTSEESCVTEALKDGWVGSIGPVVESFETRLSEHLGQETISVANGSVALILGLSALEIGPGDEVLVPDLSYAATASSVIRVGATPVFVDVSEDTWNISLQGIINQINERTKAVIVVHSYGVPAEIEAISAFCSSRGIAVIEDVAEAFNGRVRGKLLGTFGDIGTYSFFANKLITTGEGGAVTAKSQQILTRLRLLRGQGMDPLRRYWFIEPGFNFRLSSLPAAVGTAQLARLEEIVAKREEVESLYRNELWEDMDWPKVIDGGTRTPWIFTGSVKTQSPRCVRHIAEALALQGYETRPVFYPLSSMPAFRLAAGKEVLSPVAHDISKRGISLPSSHLVTSQDVSKISSIIRKERIDANNRHFRK
jgi:perosamine synthetase